MKEASNHQVLFLIVGHLSVFKKSLCQIPSYSGMPFSVFRMVLAGTLSTAQLPSPFPATTAPATTTILLPMVTSLQILKCSQHLKNYKKVLHPAFLSMSYRRIHRKNLIEEATDVSFQNRCGPFYMSLNA